MLFYPSVVPCQSCVSICVNKQLEVKFISDSREVEDKDALHNHNVTWIDHRELSRSSSVGFEVINRNLGTPTIHDILEIFYECKVGYNIERVSLKHVIDMEFHLSSRNVYLKNRLHEVRVKSIRVIKIEFSHVGQNDFMLIQLSVECVLGQRHHLLLHVALVVLTHGLHQPFADCRLSRGSSSRHPDHEGRPDRQGHLP